MKPHLTLLCERLHTHTRFSIATFIFLFSIVFQVNAQNEIKDIEKMYNVTVDSVFLKATPYKKILRKGKIYDEKKDIEFYNDIIIYELSSNSKKELIRMQPQPAIFMLPGGGFFGLSADDIDGMDLIGNLSLGSKLSNNLNAKVYIIKYVTNNSSLISNVIFPGNTDNCSLTQNETGRALTIEASYKAFHDLRKILKVNYLDSSTIKGIDVDNFYMIGVSAGAVLVVNTLYLQQNEIPTEINYKNSCSDASSTGTIDVSDDVKNKYWPIPMMKGVVSMAGAWIYDNVQHLFTISPNTLANKYRDISILFLHGTCDELIYRGEGLIGFKRPFNSFAKNVYSPNRFINGKGSEYIFNLHKNLHNKMGYGQVLEGGHSVFSKNIFIPYSWDFILGGGNLVDPVTDKIQPFIENLINGSSTWETNTFVFNPEVKTNRCKPFDNKLDTICFKYIPPPNILYDENVCDNNIYTAIVSNWPSPEYSILWSGYNVEIVGSNIGTSVQYRRMGTLPGGTLWLQVTKGCTTITYGKSIKYYENILGANSVYINSECYNGYMGAITRKFPVGTAGSFNVVYPNALLDGVTTIEWQLNCGIISGLPIEYFIGNDLYSEIHAISQSPCTDVRFRYKNECNENSTWSIHQLSGNICTSGLHVFPNPSSSYIKIDLLEGREVRSEEGILVEIVDPMGNKYAQVLLQSTSEEIDVKDLKVGVYAVVVTHGEQTFFTSFIKK